MVILEDLEKLRIQTRNNKVFLKIAAGIALLVGLLLAIFVNEFLVLIGIISAIALFFWSRHLQNKYEKALFSKNTIMTMLKKGFSDVDERTSLTAQQTFNDNKLLPPRKGTYYDVTYEGKSGSIPFLVTRVQAIDNLDEKTEYCSYKGLLISFKTERCAAHSKLIACSGKAAHNDMEMLRSVKTKNIEFDQFYNVYARQNCPLMSILDEKTIDGLNKLADHFPESNITYRFNNGNIMISIEGKDFFEKHLFNKKLSVWENAELVRDKFNFVYDLVESHAN